MSLLAISGLQPTMRQMPRMHDLTHGGGFRPEEPALESNRFGRKEELLNNRGTKSPGEIGHVKRCCGESPGS